MERTRSPLTDKRGSGQVRNGGDRVGGSTRPLRWRALRPSTLTAKPRKKTVVVCGPTAAGKSSLADALAEELSGTYEEWATTLVVDSMQVYREIPVITNQARERLAEMISIVSVAEEWTVARHKQKTDATISSLPEEVPFVLDSGTGMYLNTILLDIPLAPRVSPEIRAKAEEMAEGAGNPRRVAREIELDIAGARERGSIWSGEPRYEVTLVYVRPRRLDLSRNIKARSSKIAREGQQEAKALVDSGVVPNPSVRAAIGVKEMLLHVSGHISRGDAEEKIATRTRRLARRQIRWFDKLARSLPKETNTLVFEEARDLNIKYLMHDIIGA